MSITETDEATRDAWVAETAGQTRKRLEAVETGGAPFGEEATVAYGDEVSVIDAAIAAATPKTLREQFYSFPVGEALPTVERSSIFAVPTERVTFRSTRPRVR